MYINLYTLSEGEFNSKFVNSVKFDYDYQYY